MPASVIIAELRQSWRGLLRRPAFLLLTTFTLAMGVATITAMFALLDQALLKPLPFPQADRLVTLGAYMDADMYTAAPGYYAPIRAIPSLESAGMVDGGAVDVNIAPDGRPQVAVAMHADRGFFETLGLPMAVGRNFDQAEDRPNGPGAVILTNAFWRARFGADPSVVGRTLQVEGQGMQIVGVLPREFQWPWAVDLVLSMQPDPTSSNMSNNQLIVGRMKPGATLAGTSAETAGTLVPLLLASSDNMARTREAMRQQPPAAAPLLASVFASSTGKTLWLFLGAAACVLLIAVINLASLILLRSLTRTHASAVRAALGASTGRLSMPAFGEGLLIGLFGAAVGLALAWMGLQLIGGIVPPEWLRGEHVMLTGTSVIFALVAGLAAAAGATMLAVVRSRRRDWRSELVGGGRSGISREDGRAGRVLVVAQVAVAVVLLVGAALFTRTLHELESVPMGFISRNVTTFTLSPVKQRYVTIDQVSDLSRKVLERLRRLPEADGVGASSNLPTGSQLNWPIILPNGALATAQYRMTTPGFLEAVGVPLLTGRGISDGDVAGADPVCVVSVSFARMHFGEDSPLGKNVMLRIDDTRQVALRIVGVVGDVRQRGPAKQAPPIFYTPLAQVPDELWSVLRQFGPLSFAVRLHPGTGLDDGTLRDAVNEVAPGQPISNVRTLETVVASTTTAQRLNLLLVGIFAGLALLLASVGLYAVMSVAVTAHRHDYGVRAALGATRERLLYMVVRSAAMQVGLGLAIGLALSMVLSRLLTSFLFGIHMLDPLAIGSVLLVLGLSGLLASVPPAWRAARVRPMQALRLD
ncbi:ADOP family duplicated permease [Luteibacter sp. RCC_6_2]|uniref:ADOP family duplicated permease n=1 Tax=Luteibacter sp. RCC_6_2 TaxID=3239223 RepID=UPI003524C6E8